MMEINWESLSRAAYYGYSRPNADGSRPHASVRRLNEVRAVVAALEGQGFAVVRRDDLDRTIDWYALKVPPYTQEDRDTCDRIRAAIAGGVAPDPTDAPKETPR